MKDELDYLSISYLNELEYCERRFWLRFVDGESAINAPLLDGIYKHEQVHETGSEKRGDLTTYRQVYIWSVRLRLVGYADCVESEAGVFQPVEYKRGKKGKWLNDHIQLCAQALCLEERTGQSIESGQIFYWSNKRREQVEFTTKLRDQTEAAVERAYALLAAGKIPPPDQKKAKCRDCSLKPICLPDEIRRLTGG